MNLPIVLVSELTRKEYTAFAKPMRGLWKQVFISIVSSAAVIAFYPVLIFGLMAGIAFTSLAAHGVRPTPAALIPKQFVDLTLVCQLAWPVFTLAIIGGRFIRNALKLRRMFPQRDRPERITTTITSLAIAQTCAGSTTLTSWGNAVGVDEIPEAFIVRVGRSIFSRRSSNTELLYLPKPGPDAMQHDNVRLSPDDLHWIMVAASEGADYEWTRTNVSEDLGTDAVIPVWPPPPAAVDDGGLGVNLTGKLLLPLYNVLIDDTRLTAVLRSSVNGSRYFGLIPFAVVMTINFRNFASVGPPVVVILFILVFVVGIVYSTWRSSKFIQIDRSRGIVSLNGKRFAAVSDIESIRVVPRPAVFSFVPIGRQGIIVVRATNGKSTRLMMIESSGIAEVNLIARIVGEYLTASCIA